MKRLLGLSVAVLALATLHFSTATAQEQFDYTVDNGTIIITGYTGPGGAVEIPSTINGLHVTSIGELAFYRCSRLASVTIPDSVTSLGPYAFDGCTSLTSVTMPDSVTSIGYGAFSDCSSLTSVTIPHGVTSIEPFVFYGCSDLTSVTIGNRVTSIGEAAFAECTSLTAAYFEGDAPSVEFLAFPLLTTVVYYLSGTRGWTETFSDRPTAVWRPKVESSDGGFGVRRNQFGFNISWACERTVVVEACTDLASATWSAVSTDTLASGSAYFSDPDWANHPRRFYRVREQ